MFRSSTVLGELVQSLAKVIFLLKHSVKLCHCILCGDVAACHGTACVLTPFNDMLPHLQIIYDDVILLSVLTELNICGSMHHA